MTMYDSSHKKSHRLKALVLLASITSLGLFIDYLFEEPLLPKVNQSEILGLRSADSTIREYNINISNHIVSTVFSQLKHSTILSQKLEIAYGLDTKIYKDVIKYWIEKYDWRSREEYFNQYRQYTTIVQGLRIHFVHVKPETSNETVPLLMLHGWPESFAYFYDIVPQLSSRNGDVSFELIIPSLPGHFESDAIKMNDRTSVHVATLFKNLMKRLNIDRFYVFGQGVGSFIGTDMAILYPDNVMGLYNTMCFSLRKISLLKYASETIINNKVINADKSKYDIWKSFNKIIYFLNYMQGNFIGLDSLSFTLSSSPIALASYIWNIISIGEEYNNQLFGAIQKMDEDKLIDAVMLMITSQSTTNSIRSSQEFASMPLYQYPISSKVPCSCPKFTKQLFYQASWIYKDKFTNVVQATNFPELGDRMLLQTDKSFKYELTKDIYESIAKMINSHSN